MGTQYALTYENIFMSWFEGKFMFALLTKLRNFYLCFIDGIFIIWNGSKTEFDNFWEELMTVIQTGREA